MNPARRRAWKVLLPLGIGIVLALSGDLTLYAVLPAYAANRAFSMAAVGLLLSANRLVRLGSNPLVGLLLAGRRRRGFVLTGLALGTCSTLLYAAAADTTVFLIGRLLWGTAWSLIYIGGYTMVMDVTGEGERGWASGVMQGFFFIGLSANPLLGGVLSDQLGFVPALLVCAALSACGFLLALFTLPETAANAGRAARAAPSLITRNAPQARTSLCERLVELPRRLRPLTHLRNAAAAYIYLAVHFIGDGILLSTLSLYLQRRYGSVLPIGLWLVPVASAGGALLAFRAAAAALTAPLAGSLSDRLGSRWKGVAWGIVLATAGIITLVFFDHPLMLLGGVAVHAAGAAAIMTLIPPLAREANPDYDSGAVLGFFATAADLGMALAPLIAYLLIDDIALETLYLLAGALLGLGLPAAAAATWPRRKTAPQTGSSGR